MALLKAAKAALETEDWPAALTSAPDAIEILGTGHFPALVVGGTSALRAGGAGNLAKAEEWLSAAAALKPDALPARRGLAELHEAVGSPPDTQIAALRAVLAAGAGKPKIQHDFSKRLAAVQAASGDASGAIATLSTFAEAATGIAAASRDAPSSAFQCEVRATCRRAANLLGVWRTLAALQKDALRAAVGAPRPASIADAPAAEVLTSASEPSIAEAALAFAAAIAAPRCANEAAMLEGLC